MSDKTVFGVGINDSPTSISKTFEGKTTICPYYSKWRQMLKRCYDPKALNMSKGASYRDCYVCNSWLNFTVFRGWMMEKEWKGMVLDKDILWEGNRVYSPVYCMFVTPELNLLLRGSKKNKVSGLLEGVALASKNIKTSKRFSARLTTRGKVKNIGWYLTEKQAHLAYLFEKLNKFQTLNLEGFSSHEVLLINMYIDRIKDKLIKGSTL